MEEFNKVLRNTHSSERMHLMSYASAEYARREKYNIDNTQSYIEAINATIEYYNTYRRGIDLEPRYK